MFTGNVLFFQSLPEYCSANGIRSMTVFKPVLPKSNHMLQNPFSLTMAWAALDLAAAFSILFSVFLFVV